MNRLGTVSLRKTSEGWGFSSELALENFVWTHLRDLLQLHPFQRQYAMKGEICDILALTAENQLAILELKNVEDRYIIQQLTRYYANLLQEKPFPETIDYEQPVRLMAISPTFHRHNYIDRQYSLLSFEFIQVRVIQAEPFYLELRFEDEGYRTVQAELPFQEIDLGDQPKDLPDIPESLLKWLGGCPANDQQAVLETRRQILNFHPRMQEIVEARSIQYGTSKSKLCAEICFNRGQQRPILFLWLPLPTYSKRSNQPERIGRLRLWLEDGILKHVGHVPQGLGKMRLREEWDTTPKSKWPRRSLIHNGSHRSMTPVPIKGYVRSSLGGTAESLSSIVSIALQKWLDKL
ncbi:MAG: recombinase RecB [Leptolyngbya sp. SIO1E4]|nr:recombinase RecB [Leptolyngbya sp. SIO1E4]